MSFCARNSGYHCHWSAVSTRRPKVPSWNSAKVSSQKETLWQTLPQTASEVKVISRFAYFATRKAPQTRIFPLWFPSHGGKPRCAIMGGIFWGGIRVSWPEVQTHIIRLRWWSPLNCSIGLQPTIWPVISSHCLSCESPQWLQVVVFLPSHQSRLRSFLGLRIEVAKSQTKGREGWWKMESRLGQSDC